MSAKQTQKCAGCRNAILRREFLKCEICKEIYDLECANVSYKLFSIMERKNSWKCPECISKRPKVGNLNTPARKPSNSNACNISPNSLVDESYNVTQRIRQPAASAELSSPSEVNDSECDDPMSEIKLYVNEMRAMRKEMSSFLQTMAALTDTIKAQNARLDGLESRIEILENRTPESQHNEVTLLQESISLLKMEIQDRDQEFLLNDVEISNFPEIRNENCTHVMLTVAKKLGMDLDERDIVSAERVGPVRAFVEGSAAPRPRPLVVRLARRAPRDQLLRAARVRRGLTTEGMSVQDSPTHSYYINERLTKSNRQLFQKTREEAKRRSWKYVWTREGRIFVRRDQGTISYRIRSDNDISKVFSVKVVST